MGKLKDQLAGVAALIGVLGAIGAGFIKYGEMQEQLNSVADLDLKPLNKEIAILDKTIKVLELEIKEIKASSKNPLAN